MTETTDPIAELALIRERVNALILRHEAEAAQYREDAGRTLNPAAERSSLADAAAEHELAVELHALLEGTGSPLDELRRQTSANALTAAANGRYDDGRYIGHPNTWSLQERRDSMWRARLERRADDIMEGFLPHEPVSVPAVTATPTALGACPGAGEEHTLLTGMLTRSRDAVDKAVQLLRRRTTERDQAISDASALRDVIQRVDALTAIHEYGATRWADPLPVPEWVGQVREIIAPHIPSYDDAGDGRGRVEYLQRRAGLI